MSRRKTEQEEGGKGLIQMLYYANEIGRKRGKRR